MSELSQNSASSPGNNRPLSLSPHVLQTAIYQMKVYSSRISNLNIKYETNGWRPLPHTDPGPVDKWTKCLQEFSDLDPGLVLGPLSQMTINYHQQVSSEDPIFTIGHLSPSSREAERRPPRLDPVLIIKTPAGEPGKLQMMMTRPWLCQLYSPRLIDASDIPSGRSKTLGLRAGSGYPRQ